MSEENDSSRESIKVQRLPPSISHPVDVYVGGRVRLCRILLGMTQEKLGDAVGMSFQQIQKNERGINRIGASRLYEFSQVLDVPVSFFFDCMPEELKTHEGRFAAGLHAKEHGIPEANPLAKTETLKLVRAYNRIKNQGVRRSVFELIKALAKPKVGD